MLLSIKPYTTLNGLTTDDYYPTLKLYFSALCCPSHAIIHAYLILNHNISKAMEIPKAKIKVINYTTQYVYSCKTGLSLILQLLNFFQA